MPRPLYTARAARRDPLDPPLIDSDWLSAYINILFRHAAMAKVQLIGSFRQPRADIFQELRGVSPWFAGRYIGEEKKTEAG